MKILTAICLLCIAANLPAQRLDIGALQSRCLPTVPLTTLNAIIRVESGGNPNAMQIDLPRTLLKQWHLPEGTLQLMRQPTNQREALEWLAYFERRAIFVDLGLMQVSTAKTIHSPSGNDGCINRCRHLVRRVRVPKVPGISHPAGTPDGFRS